MGLEGGIQSLSPIVRRGTKRFAEENLERDQRLAKRLGRLSLERPPLDGPTSSATRTASGATSGSSDGGLLMQVDDTKDRIFIANLEDELAHVAAEDDEIVFLPQIERRMTKIPKSLLTSHNPALAGTGKELVLYNVPTSLSVPQEQDSVRKAIVEVRERQRERGAEERSAAPAPVEERMNAGSSAEFTASDSFDDVDAMDIG